MGFTPAAGNFHVLPSLPSFPTARISIGFVSAGRPFTAITWRTTKRTSPGLSAKNMNLEPLMRVIGVSSTISPGHASCAFTCAASGTAMCGGGGSPPFTAGWLRAIHAASSVSTSTLPPGFTTRTLPAMPLAAGPIPCDPVANHGLFVDWCTVRFSSRMPSGGPCLNRPAPNDTSLPAALETTQSLNRTSNAAAGFDVTDIPAPRALSNEQPTNRTNPFTNLSVRPFPPHTLADERLPTARQFSNVIETGAEFSFSWLR